MKLKRKQSEAWILLQLLIAILLLEQAWVNGDSCLTGYFSQNGIWTKWATSWYTWTNATEWETCHNRFFNKSTKLWEFCPYGQFYSTQVDKWSSWDGSWRDEWGYQSECYVCPSGMKFDLTLLKWVNNWTSSQLFIQDPSMRNIPLWRDPVYYVDTGSIQPIELGTK